MHSLGYGTRGLGRTAKVTNFLFISLSFHCRTFCKLIKSFMLPCRCRNLDLSWIDQEFLLTVKSFHLLQLRSQEFLQTLKNF